MKKVFLFIIGAVFISNVSFADIIPQNLSHILLSKTWNGTYTNDAGSGADGYHNISLNFTLNELENLEGMITIFGVKIGNGVFNPSEFLTLDYKARNTDGGFLYLSYLDPRTRGNRATYTFKATTYSHKEISGLVYLTDPKEGKTWKIGIFKVR
jgi:hypothetical protein